jgi:hypothetical protein
MRHTWSLVAGAVFTPLAWFLIAFGQGAMTGPVSLANSRGDFLLGGLLIVGVGLMLGLIGSLRTSPVGALFTSVVYLGISIYAFTSPLTDIDLFGRIFKVGSYDVVLATPVNHGVLAAVGGMLLMAIFSPARWKGGQVPEDPNAWKAPEPAPPWQPPPTVAVPTSGYDPNRSS